MWGGPPVRAGRPRPLSPPFAFLKSGLRLVTNSLRQPTGLAALFGNQPKRDHRARISLNAQNLTAVVD